MNIPSLSKIKQLVEGKLKKMFTKFFEKNNIYGFLNISHLKAGLARNQTKNKYKLGLKLSFYQRVEDSMILSLFYKHELSIGIDIFVVHWKY